jgi:hypothetical protein
VPIHPKTTTLNRFKGIDNISSPEATSPDLLKEALNIELDKNGEIHKRKGYTKEDTGFYSSLWSNRDFSKCFAVKNGDLVKINSDLTSTLIRAGVGRSLISFEEVDDVVYYSSININGKIYNNVNLPWGIGKNLLAPSLSRGTGTLPAGTYQVAFTLISPDGLESGTVPASIITVPDNSSINVGISLPVDSNTPFAKVYCSLPNGNTLYYSGISLLNSVYTITSHTNLINPLITSNLDAPIKGHIVKYYRGRIYIADDNILYYTEPFMYNHIDLSKNYIEFPKRIKDIMPVEDGIWVSSNHLHYLSGDAPESFKRTSKEYISTVEGTSVLFSGSYLHLENTPVGYKWLITSNLGVFILFNQGLVINMTSGTYNPKTADTGTGLFLQDGGINRYLTILRENERNNNSVFGDFAEATIIRNGIAI